MKYALLKKPAKGDKIYANFIFKVGDENSLTGKNIIPELNCTHAEKRYHYKKQKRY